MRRKRKKHIVVADDEENMLRSFEFILEAADYKVSSATDGREALSIIREARKNRQPVDLLITDLLMPGMSGTELIAELRAARIDIPVLVITGHGSKEALVELMRLGCNDYLDKPIEDEELLNRISQLINQQESNITHISEA